MQQAGFSPSGKTHLAFDPGQLAGLVVPPPDGAGALAAGVEGDGDVLSQRQLCNLPHHVACPVPRQCQACQRACRAAGADPEMEM